MSTEWRERLLRAPIAPRSRGSGLLVAFAAVTTLTSCEIEKIGIPQTEQRIALHSVLSATASSQVVLLERTRNGSVEILAPPFDLADPIVSDEGIAETNAFVRLVTPAGDTLVAVEDSRVREDRKGAGIYRFALPGDQLVRGAEYTLIAQTTRNERLQATTTVPEGVPALAVEQRGFDRGSDTLSLSWPRIAGARSYFVRIETPYGPRSFFTESTTVRLTGELRNADVTSLPRVFIPGFPQAVTVSAVDSNYYDWFRTHNDRISGTGLANRVSGGLGVFGSLVRLHFHELRIGTAQTEPIAGQYYFDGPPEERAATLVLELELHLESRAARSDQADAVSGRYARRPSLGYSGELINGMLGTVRDGRIELAMLRGWTAKDTVDVFTGEVRGDTIVGGFRLFGGRIRFVR